ncbi:hypothetical protein [Leifsonia aquatica]|uniref:hypothetical protein n=1 Tax=Leifsonia aquatica TaxID=144185 RepID=UPI0037FA7C22
MNMLTIYGPACAWLLVATGTSLYRNNSRVTTVIAAAPAALMITILQRPVYLAVDSLLGGHNWLSLAHQSLCIVAAVLFLQLIFHASEAASTEEGISGSRFGRRRRLVTIIGGFAIGLQLLLFPWGLHLASDPWLEAGGGDIRVAVYSSISWAALGAVAIVGLPAALAEIRRRSSRTMVVSLAVTGAGALVALFATVLHVAIVINGFTGDPTGSLRETMIDAVNLGGGTITLGFALPRLLYVSRAAASNVRDRLLLLQLHALWKRLGVADVSALVWAPKAKAWQDALTPKARARLRRRWVEVNDHLVVHPSIRLRGLEASTIEDVEQRLHSDSGYVYG